MKIGVNFDGFKIADYQNRLRPEPPIDYIHDSFRIFSDNGLNLIRIPVYWESYEKDPQGFMHELEIISCEADKCDISCIYDNHQWECSSFLGFGIGFPNSIVSQVFQSVQSMRNSSSPPLKSQVEKFWNCWWDRTVKNNEGRDGWDVQSVFLKKVIDTVHNKKSTVGFEILNEPHVFRWRDFKKVSDYHDYIIRRAVDSTDKVILFCYAYAGRINAFNLPWMQARIRPSLPIKNNTMFDIHPYPPYYIVMLYFKLISKLMKTKSIFVGEYNSGTGNKVAISLSQHKRYLSTLKKFSPYGVTFWQWSYIRDNGHPAFNLTRVADGKIASNGNLENLINALKATIK